MSYRISQRDTGSSTAAPPASSLMRRSASLPAVRLRRRSSSAMAAQAGGSSVPLDQATQMPSVQVSPIVLPERVLLDLSGGRLGQRRDELHVAGCLESRDTCLDMLYQFRLGH